MILVLLDIWLIYERYQITIEITDVKIYSRYSAYYFTPTRIGFSEVYKKDYLHWVLGFDRYQRTPECARLNDK